MSTKIDRRSLLRAGAVLAGSSAVALAGGEAARAQIAQGPSPVAGQGKSGVSVGFIIGAASIADQEGSIRVEVPMLCEGRTLTVRTQPVDESAAEAIAGSVSEGRLVDFLTSGDNVVVADNPSETFHTVLTKETRRDRTVFVTQKYGPELAPRGGTPGAMVAAGWVYAKGHRTITIGDGRVVTEDISGRALPQPSKRYEETYKVANDVEVYEVNTQDWEGSVPSSFDAIPVTRDYAYSTTDRQAAFVVFDRSFLRAPAARVKQIYYFTPQDISDGKPVWDVPTQSDLLSDKGVDPVSGQPYVEIAATGVTAAPYTRSTEPFEIVPGTFYCVGDNEVSLYLFNCNMGTGSPRDDRLVLLDAGWPNSGYQYWKNIEAVGFDPRDIDYILMPHAHGDHYGTTVELVTMIENAGGEVELISPQEDVLGLDMDAIGNTWNLSGDLPGSQTLIRERTQFYEYDQWMDFGNVRLKPLQTPGHTTGTTSFIFDVENPADGQRLTFGYMGGYGWNNRAVTSSNGWRRLSFAYGLAWLQQTVDVDFVTGQHANQYPIVEVYQALKAYNNDPANRKRQLTMLDALARDEWVNYLEKRYAVSTHAITETDPRNQSIENFGPFKPGREGGVHDVRVRLVDGGRVLHGFQRAQNINARIPLLANGVVIGVDSFVHDPDGWYVQFELDVLDSYNGFLPGVGPVESIRPQVAEVLRTQRFDTQTEAEAVLDAVEVGGTYRVDLTPASAIAIPDDGSPVFKAD
jgi:glyoxylase-like metal-dependent hydrolase (beta-lactamase superfamily II)